MSYLLAAAVIACLAFLGIATFHAFATRNQNHDQ